MKTLFSTDNTTGYTEKELDELNEEFLSLLAEKNIEENTDEYFTASKNFADEVASR